MSSKHSVIQDETVTDCKDDNQDESSAGGEREKNTPSTSQDEAVTDCNDDNLDGNSTGGEPEKNTPSTSQKRKPSDEDVADGVDETDSAAVTSEKKPHLNASYDPWDDLIFEYTTVGSVNDRYGAGICADSDLEIPWVTVRGDGKKLMGGSLDERKNDVGGGGASNVEGGVNNEDEIKIEEEEVHAEDEKVKKEEEVADNGGKTSEEQPVEKEATTMTVVDGRNDTISMEDATPAVKMPAHSVDGSFIFESEMVPSPIITDSEDEDGGETHDADAGDHEIL